MLNFLYNCPKIGRKMARKGGLRFTVKVPRIDIYNSEEQRRFRPRRAREAPVDGGIGEKLRGVVFTYS